MRAPALVLLLVAFAQPASAQLFENSNMTPNRSSTWEIAASPRTSNIIDAMNSTQKSLLFWAVLAVTGLVVYWVSLKLQ